MLFYQNFNHLVALECQMTRELHRNEKSTKCHFLKNHSTSDTKQYVLENVIF